MKKVVIACGAGLATSSMVKSKVEDILKKMVFNLRQFNVL